MTPNVSLPMYNLPEMRADDARFWEALRELFVEAEAARSSREVDFRPTARAGADRPWRLNLDKGRWKGEPVAQMGSQCQASRASDRFFARA